MKYTLEIQKLLYQVEDNKSLTPKDRIRLLKQAAYIADDNDDMEWAYEIRLQLIRQCFYVANGTDLVNEFSWLLNAYEAHPDWFDENDFLWQYKWILGEMYSNPQVTKEQITHIQEDFKNRLLRNGYGLRPYYDRLYDEALIRKQFTKAKEYLDLRNDAPDDGMGSCAACTLDNELDYYMQTGQFEEAYHRAEPLLNRQIACTHVPARTFCALAYYAVKAGKAELAKELAERADAEMEELLNDENMVSPAGMLICYLLPVNPARGWGYLEKSLSWFLESDIYSRMDYACFVLEGLLKLDPASQVTLNLPVDFECYNPQHIYSVASLIDYFRREAETNAKAFDERDGCCVHSDRLLEIMPR